LPDGDVVTDGLGPSVFGSIVNDVAVAATKTDDASMNHFATDLVTDFFLKVNFIPNIMY